MSEIVWLVMVLFEAAVYLWAAVLILVVGVTIFMKGSQ